MKKILYLLFAFVIFGVGALGGLFAQAALLPYMAGHDLYKDWGFVKEWNSRIVVVRQIEQITIGQREGLDRVIENAEKVVVGVQSVKGGTTVAGSGLIYTSEGLIVTLASVVPQGYVSQIYIGNSKEPIGNAQVLKRDQQNNLALLKVDKGNLPTASFAPKEDVRLGSPVVLIGKSVGKEGGMTSSVNEGIVKVVALSSIKTTIIDSLSLQGSPLFDLNGRVLGLGIIERDGFVSVIPSTVLKPFLEGSLGS